MATVRMIKTAAAALVVALFAGVGFIYFAFGGFEKYGPPIHVVIPKNFTGVACGRWVEGEQRAETTWRVDSRGYFKVSGEIQSHRPRIFHYQDPTTGDLALAPADIWHPIFTENEPKTGVVFSVTWVGNIEGWKKRVAANDVQRVCLGRF